MWPDVAERIQVAAELRGLSLRDLATRAGLSHSTVSALLRSLRSGGSVRPSLTTLEAIARVLGTSRQWLLAGEGDAPEREAPAASPASAPDALPVPSSAADLVSQLVRVVSRPERYPNRQIAAELARQAGDVPAEAIASVLRDSLQAKTDPPVLWWADRMRIRATWLESGELPGEPYDAPRPPGIRKR